MSGGANQKANKMGWDNPLKDMRGVVNLSTSGGQESDIFLIFFIRLIVFLIISHLLPQFGSPIG